MTLADVVALCIRTHRARLGQPDAPVSPEEREAMESVLAVAAAHNPPIMALIEQAKGVAVADELRAQRAKRERAALEDQARPIIEAVAREATAATGFEITVAFLRGPSRWEKLTPWRYEAWDRLGRAGMTRLEIGILFGVKKHAVSVGINRRAEWERMRGSEAERVVK